MANQKEKETAKRDALSQAKAWIQESYPARSEAMRWHLQNVALEAGESKKGHSHERYSGITDKTTLDHLVALVDVILATDPNIVDDEALGNGKYFPGQVFPYSSERAIRVDYHVRNIPGGQEECLGNNAANLGLSHILGEAYVSVAMKWDGSAVNQIEVTVSILERPHRYRYQFVLSRDGLGVIIEKVNPPMIAMPTRVTNVTGQRFQKAKQILSDCAKKLAK